jgi:RNA polymerase sigma-70 factor (ECF subfamily)
MRELPETSHSLIARVKDPADGAAWTEFLAIYRPVVYRLARHKGMQDSDAEDLVQQVFLAIARAIDKWEPGDGKPPFRHWLSKIARNAILNALTRRKLDIGAGSTSIFELLNEHPDDDLETSSEFLRESRRELFRWAADEIRSEFTEVTWAMFWETAVVGRPVEEVAAELQRTSGAVYMARCRVMQRLKEKVAQATQT